MITDGCTAKIIKLQNHLVLRNLVEDDKIRQCFVCFELH